MTDFYALLKQSIIERDIRDAAARETVYAQAREAIIKQLWAFQPPLAADEIDTRVGAYDTAVERIETDLQLAFANGEIPEKTKPERPKAERRPPPPPPPPPEPEPFDEAEIDEEDAPPIAEWNGDPAGDEAYADYDFDGIRLQARRAACPTHERPHRRGAPCLRRRRHLRRGERRRRGGRGDAKPLGRSVQR